MSCSLLTKNSFQGAQEMQLWLAEKLVARGRNLAALYKEMNVDRFLIRIPGTWQGIQAVKQLESEGIPCHVTLIYRCPLPFTALPSCQSCHPCRDRNPMSLT